MNSWNRQAQRRQAAPRESRQPGDRPARPKIVDDRRSGSSRGGRLDDHLRDTMLDAVPRLRAFAISLCGNVDKADDLVQETLLRALSHIDQFQPGTNMSAWLFTILRNLFRSDYRKRRREV